MVIFRPDGSCYEPLGAFREFDPESPEHDLFNRYDQELIEISGSPIIYYEVFLNKIDPLYLEARGKFWSTHGVELRAVYEPIGSTMNQGLFGIDGDDTMVFYFNYRSVLDTLGKPPVIGSRLFTPHKRENWEIVDRKAADFYRYGELRLELHCERFQEDIVTAAGKPTQPQPNFVIN